MSLPVQQEQQPPRRREPSPASRHYVPIVFTRDDFPNVYRPRHDPPTPTPPTASSSDGRHVLLSSRMAPTTATTTTPASLDAIKASPMNSSSSPTLLSRIRTPPQREQRDRDRNNIHISNNISNTRLPPRPGFALPGARMEHPLPERPRATWNDTPPRSTFRKVERDTYRPPPLPPPPPSSNSQGYDSYRPAYDSDYSHYSNHNRYNSHYNPRQYSHYSPRAPLSPLSGPSRTRYYDRRLPRSSRSDNSRSRSRSRSRSLSRSRSRSRSSSRSRSPTRRYRPPTRSRSKSPRSRSRSRSRVRSRSRPRSLRSRIRSRSRSRPRSLRSRLRSRSRSRIRSRSTSRSRSRSRSRPRSLRSRMRSISRSRSRSRLRGRSPSRVRMRMRNNRRTRSRSRSRGRGRESPSRSRSRSRRRYTPPRGGDFYRSYSRRRSRSKSRGRSRSSSRGRRRPLSSVRGDAKPRAVSSPRSVSRSRSSIASSRASSVNNKGHQFRSLLERVGRGQEEAICSSKHDTTVLLPISDDIPSLASVMVHPPPEDIVMNTLGPSPATPPSLASQALHALQALQALQTPQTSYLHTPHTPIISPQPQLLLSPFSPVNQLDDEHHHPLFQQSAEDVRPSPLSPSPASSPIGSPVQMEVDVDVDVRMRVEVGDSVRVDEVDAVEEEGEEVRDLQEEKNQDVPEQVQIQRAPSEESVVEIVADSRAEFAVHEQQEPKPEPQTVVAVEPEKEEVEATQPSSPVIIVEGPTTTDIEDASVVAQPDVLFELGLEPTTSSTTGWSDTAALWSPSPPPLPRLPSPSPPPSTFTPQQEPVEKQTPKPVPSPVTRSTPFLPPPPPVIPETPVLEPKEIAIKDIPSLADAKSTAEVLRVVVMTRHFCDGQTREERVDPVLKTNLSISEQGASRPSTSVHQLIGEVCGGKRQLDRLAAFTTGIRSALAKQLSDREAERMARIQKLRKEYVALHQKWVQHCALLDEQSRALTSEVEVVQPAGRTTRRSAATMGDAVRSDLEMEQIIASLGNDEATDPAHLSLRNLAMIPDMVSVTHGKVNYAYDDTNHLVENPAEYYGPQTGTHDWTEEEKKAFLDKFAEYPKQFGVIAEFLPNKTTRQCVAFYYLHKKTIDFRKVVSQFAPNKRKKRGAGRKKGIIADIQQHDAEVSGSGGGRRRRACSGAAVSEASGVDLLTVPSRPSKGRRAAQAEGGGKKGGRRTAIIQQQEGTPLSTPTPEPENATNVMKIDIGTTSHATGTSSSATTTATTTTNATSATRGNNRRKRRQHKGGENEDAADKGADSQRPVKRIKRSRIKSASIIIDEPSDPVEESSSVSTPVPPSTSTMVVDSASAKGLEQSEATSSNHRRRNTSVTPVQWSDADKELFLTLLAQHGDDLKRIAASMPNKTMVQVKEFYKNIELDLERVVASASAKRSRTSSSAEAEPPPLRRQRSRSSVPVVDQVQQQQQPPMDNNNENGEGSESIHGQASSSSSLSAAVLAENQRPMYAIPTEGWLNKPDPRHYTEDGNQTLSMRFKPPTVKFPDPPKVPPLLPNKPALPRLLTVGRDHHPQERVDRAECIQKKTTAATAYWASAMGWSGSANGTSDSSRSLVKDHVYNPLAEMTSWQQPPTQSGQGLPDGRGQRSSSVIFPGMGSGGSTDGVRLLADLDAEAPVSACRTGRVTRVLDPVYLTTSTSSPPSQSLPASPPVITSSRVIQPIYSTTSPPPPPQSPPSPPVMSSRRRLMSVAALTGADDAVYHHSPYPVLSSSQTASTTVPPARFYS